MPFNIQDLISSIAKTGVAKNSSYEVRVFPPSFKRDISDMGTPGVNRLETQAAISMRAITTDLPGRNIKTTDYTVGNGWLQQIGYGTSFGQIGMSIVLSEDLSERVFFEQWQEQIAYAGGFIRQPMYTANYYDNYVGTIDITQFDQKADRRYTMRLNNAFPNFINPTTLSYSDENQYQILNVQISYQSWDRVLFNPTGPTGLIDSIFNAL